MICARVGVCELQATVGEIPNRIPDRYTTVIQQNFL